MGHSSSNYLMSNVRRSGGGLDRRGFEWYYWKRKLTSGHRTFVKQIGGVSSVAFSSDGKRLASATGFGRTVKVWDVATGREIITLTHKGRHLGSVHLAFSPDGETLAATYLDDTTTNPRSAASGVVILWNVSTGQEVLTLVGHTANVTSVAFSPDGKRLASASLDKTVKVWSTATGQAIGSRSRSIRPTSLAWRSAPTASDSPPQALTGRSRCGTPRPARRSSHSGAYRLLSMSVAFSPDGKRLASASDDGTVKVWDDARPARRLSPSRGIPASSRAWRSAPTASDSPPRAVTRR